MTPGILPATTTVASVGVLITNPGLSIYQTSKLVLVCLVEFTGVEYGGKGIELSPSLGATSPRS